MASSITPLIQQIRACKACEPSLPLGASPVIQASSNSKILIAGQAPSLTVHRTGKPFDDASGKRLRTWLNVDEATFYDAEQFAIIPMAFCYPGKGKSGDLPPPPLCATTWHDTLLKALDSVELTVIIGQHAQKYHLEKDKPLTKQVANWQQHLPKRIVLPHPSPRNQFWIKNNPWFEEVVLPQLKSRVQQILTP